MYSQKVVHDRLSLPKREKYKNYPTTTSTHEGYEYYKEF